ncbi:unnamed protein product [Amoebophrya sp. A120]|nr:unnamed protein product [Amoebophrya sp. A120]|eukprot:GSA120T00019378001.1
MLPIGHASGSGPARPVFLGRTGGAARAFSMGRPARGKEAAELAGAPPPVHSLSAARRWRAAREKSRERKRPGAGSMEAKIKELRGACPAYPTFPAGRRGRRRR